MNNFSVLANHPCMLEKAAWTLPAINSIARPKIAGADRAALVMVGSAEGSGRSTYAGGAKLACTLTGPITSAISIKLSQHGAKGKSRGPGGRLCFHATLDLLLPFLALPVPRLPDRVVELLSRQIRRSNYASIPEQAACDRRAKAELMKPLQG